jgi:hypothetical protein
MRAGPSGQLRATGTVIRMDVRVDDVRHAEALIRRECDVGVYVIGAGVNDRTFA